MERLLARLERRFGKFAIPNTAAILIGGMGLVYLLGMMRPDVGARLILDPRAVLHGEVWRLVTYVFQPPDTSPIWFVFVLLFEWTILSSLEAEWGSFKLDVYFLVAMLATTIAAFATGASVGNLYISESCLFAFATLFPDYEILLFMVLPLKVKWLGWLAAAQMAYAFVVGGWPTRAAIIAGLASYFLFFAPEIRDRLRSRNLKVRQAARRVSTRPPPGSTGARACAICGAREDQGADIRVCSCERCRATGGPRTLCLEHARNH